MKASFICLLLVILLANVSPEALRQAESMLKSSPMETITELEPREKRSEDIDCCDIEIIDKSETRKELGVNVQDGRLVLKVEHPKGAWDFAYETTFTVRLRQACCGTIYTGNCYLFKTGCCQSL